MNRLSPVWPALLSVALLLFACASAPPPDNLAASPRAEQREETQGLEKAQAECVKHGKHAVAQRTEGETLYTCAD